MFIPFSPFSTFENDPKQLTRDTGRDLRHRDIQGNTVNPGRNLEAGQGPQGLGESHALALCIRAAGGSFEEIFLFDDTGRYSGYNTILSLIHNKFSMTKKKV